MTMDNKRILYLIDISYTSSPTSPAVHHSLTFHQHAVTLSGLVRHGMLNLICTQFSCLCYDGEKMLDKRRWRSHA